MGLTVRGVAHTGITVRDLDAAVDFWHGVLGFEVARRFELTGEFAANVTGVPDAHITAAVVAGHGHTVELLQYLAPTDRIELRPRPCDVGSWHLALEVDDLDAAVTAIVAHGWRLAGTPQAMTTGPRAGTRYAYLHGLDGVTLELIQPAQS